MRVGDNGAQRQASNPAPIPQPGTKKQAKTIAGVLAAHNRRAASAPAPAEFVNALRADTPGTVHTVVINYVKVQFTSTEAATGCDPARAAEVWLELRRVVASSEHSGLNPALPRELATATWERAGHRIHVYRPGAPAGRLRRRLAALSPVPALYALGQTVTGGVTAAGLVVAPLTPIPSGPAWPPISLPITADADNLTEMPQWIVANTPDTGPPAARTTPTSRRPSPAPSASASTSPDTAPSPAATRAPAIVPPVSPLPETEATPAATSTTDAPTTAASPTPSTEPTVEVQPTPTITPTLRKILPPRPHTRPHPRKKHHGRHLLPEFLRPR